MKSPVIALLAAAACPVLVAAAPVYAADQIVVAMSSPDIGNVDPHRATTTQDKPMSGWVFNGLVRFKPGDDDVGALEPDLAESWENSADGLVWTFRLRKGVQFHRGYGEMTSEDVVFSLKRAADPKTSSFSADYASFAKVEAVDPHTVRITLARPAPSLLGLVANYHGGNIVSKKAVEALGDDFRVKAIGTGPFMAGEYTPQQSIVFEAHTAYFRGAPKLKRIVYRFIPSDATRDLAFRAGELDVVYGVQSEQWVERTKKNPDVIVDVMRPAELQTIHLNMAKAPLDNKLVREAVATALDRKEYVVFTGASVTREGDSVVPTGNLGHAPSEVFGQGNAQRARELLAQAGFPGGVTLKMVQTSLPQMLRVAQVAQAQLAKAGITLQLDVVDHQTFHANIRKDMSQVVYYSAARFPIADVYLTQFYHSRSIVGTPTAATNFSHCAVADAEIDGARVEQDRTRQIDLWRQAQSKIAAEICAVPLHEQLLAWARRSAVDYGYKPAAAMHLGPQITELTIVR